MILPVREYEWGVHGLQPYREREQRKSRTGKGMWQAQQQGDSSGHANSYPDPLPDHDGNCPD